MSDESNEFEWRRHLLTALDNVSKSIEENSKEHTLIRAEIASVKVDVAAFKADMETVKKVEPNKELEKYMNSSRGWRITIVGQMLTILAMIFAAIWWGGSMNERVIQLKENQVKNISMVEKVAEDMTIMKTVSIGYKAYHANQSADTK